MRLQVFDPAEVALTKEDITAQLRNTKPYLTRRVDILHDPHTRELKLGQLAALAENQFSFAAHFCRAVVIPHTLGVIALNENLDKSWSEGNRRLFHPSLPDGYALAMKVPKLSGAERPSQQDPEEYATIQDGIKNYRNIVRGMVGWSDADTEQLLIVQKKMFITNTRAAGFDVPPNMPKGKRIAVVSDLDWMFSII